MPSIDEELDAIERLEDPDGAPEPTVGRGQRLHPLSPLFEIGRSFFALVVPGLIVLFLAAGDEYEIWYMALFVPAVASSLWRYLFRRHHRGAQ